MVIKDFFEGIKQMLDFSFGKQVSKLERFVVKKGYLFKRTIFKWTLQLFLLLCGVAFLLVGLILLLNKVIPLDWLLLGIGIVLTYSVLLLSRFR